MPARCDYYVFVRFFLHKTNLGNKIFEKLCIPDETVIPLILEPLFVENRYFKQGNLCLRKPGNRCRDLDDLALRLQHLGSNARNFLEGAHFDVPSRKMSGAKYGDSNNEKNNSNSPHAEQLFIVRSKNKAHLLRYSPLSC